VVQNAVGTDLSRPLGNVNGDEDAINRSLQAMYPHSFGKAQDVKGAIGMRTQPVDANLEAEQARIGPIRKAPIAKRFEVR